MAKKYDVRTDALVMETRTLWDDVTIELSSQEKRDLAVSLHASAEHAAELTYERSHTGFTRVIRATNEDIERLRGKEPINALRKHS